MAEYIEREKLLELLKNRKIQYPMEKWQKCGFEGGWHDAIDEIEDDIKSIHASDVVPVVHGHWECSDEPYNIQTARCSNCKTEYYVSNLDEIGGDEIVPYCPNCGAKMDGGEENA